MKILGLVTEYNPFHNGHLHHLQASKEACKATHTIAVMSGHFLQRGEPALLDKWERAKQAVDSGVDLVIELPTLFSCASAEYFASGAIALLNDLNHVDAVCFGSEAGNIKEMEDIASILTNPTPLFQASLDHFLSEGHSYPKARSLALEDEFNTFSFKPNNILGIEYIKAAKVFNANFEVKTIKRIQADYMSTRLEGTIASATAIRQALHKELLEDIEQFVPNTTFNSIKVNKHIFKENIGDLLLYKIRTLTSDDIALIDDVTEGLEHRIKKAGQLSLTYEDLIDNIISKRYTQTRIQRILIKILLDIKKSDLRTKPLYARILAFNYKGKEILNKIKKDTSIPLVTNINKIQLDKDALEMLQFDLKATDIYNLLNQKKAGCDHLRRPYILKDNIK